MQNLDLEVYTNGWFYKNKKEAKMAWFELDPNPAHDPIAVAHLESNQDPALEEGWAKDQEISDEMAKLGIKSDDEFVKHAAQLQIVTRSAGQISIQNAA